MVDPAPKETDDQPSYAKTQPRNPTNLDSIEPPNLHSHHQFRHHEAVQRPN